MQLQNILTDEQTKAGFSVEEDSDDFVYLLQHGKRAATFVWHVPLGVIRANAQMRMNPITCTKPQRPATPEPFKSEARELGTRLALGHCLREEYLLSDEDPELIIREYLQERFTEPTDYSEQP